ncbi:unannotated protein [freshwater metagenome]|uniref:Unannotated protein n=1 Tax=freshwater metagenome TaxID=449393 RepID=A0A6J6MA74_9ZZZZ
MGEPIDPVIRLRIGLLQIVQPKVLVSHPWQLFAGVDEFNLAFGLAAGDSLSLVFRNGFHVFIRCRAITTHHNAVEELLRGIH